MTNIVILEGRLTRDPELRYTSSGQAVTTLSVVNSRAFKDKNGDKKEEVSFIDVEAWGNTAEWAAKWLGKGKPVHVRGRLKQESWESDGQKRSKLVISADKLEFITWGGATTEKAEVEEKETKVIAPKPVSEKPPKSLKPSVVKEGDIPF